MDEGTEPVPARLGVIDTSRITPELCAALALAQEQAKTVDKAGRNRDRNYRYATADDMIAAGRAARRGTGLALLTIWGTVPAALPRKGQDFGAQWVHATVEIRWVLTHAGGGLLSGVVHVDAIASKGRPPDKAIAAALTYGEGFLERGLMRLDRDEDPDDVDQRADDRPADHRPAPAQPPSGPRLDECQTAEELRAWCEDCREMVAEHGAKGLARVVGHADRIGVQRGDVLRWLGHELAPEDEAA